MSPTTKVTLVCGSLFIGICTTVFAQEYSIISFNKELKELSDSKAKKLYRGKTKRLNGNRIELSDWPENSEVRTNFYKGLLRKNSAQMNAYWASLSFSGKARPPQTIDTADTQALIDWLKENNKRIGYAPTNEVPENANIIYTVTLESR